MSTPTGMIDEEETASVGKGIEANEGAELAAASEKRTEEEPVEFHEKAPEPTAEVSTRSTMQAEKRKVEVEGAGSIEETVESVEKKPKTDSDERLYDLGGRKKVSVSTFKGTRLVNVREYFKDEKTGQEKPGKKGIALNQAQWEALVALVPALQEDFTKPEA